MWVMRAMVMAMVIMPISVVAIPVIMVIFFFFFMLMMVVVTIFLVVRVFFLMVIMIFVAMPVIMVILMITKYDGFPEWEQIYLLPGQQFRDAGILG